MWISPTNQIKQQILYTTVSRMDQFHGLIKSVETFLLDWARPEGWGVSPLANYPLASFDTAVMIAIGYLCFVLFGSVRKYINV